MGPGGAHRQWGQACRAADRIPPDEFFHSAGDGRRRLHRSQPGRATRREGHGVRAARQLRHRAAREPRDVLEDVELVEGDIQSYERAHNAVSGCEVVLHQAALPSVPRSVQDPLTSNATNVTGTLNVLLAARDAGCAGWCSPRRPRSTARTPSCRSTRRSPPCRSPLRRGEARRRGLLPRLPRRSTGSRPWRSATSTSSVRGRTRSPVRGRRSRSSSPPPRRRAPVVYGDGEQSRDFTYVDNVVEAMLAGTPRAWVSLPSTSPSPVGSGSRQPGFSMQPPRVDREPKSKPSTKQARPGDVPHSLA